MQFKILKTIPASGFLTALECTKFVFGRGSAADFAGESYSCFKGTLIVRGGVDREERSKVRGGIREGEGTPPNANSWSDAAAPHVYNTPPSIPAYVHAAC